MIDELTAEEWRTIRRALAYQYESVRKRIKRAYKVAEQGQSLKAIGRPSELAMEAADVFTVWNKLKTAGLGGP